MKTLPIAIQVYSVREEAAQDFAGTMREIKEMGYDGVELAGLYDLKPEEIRDCLKETGLVPISAHVPYQAFLEDMDTTIQSYCVIGCRYLAIPYLTEECRYGTDKFDEFIKQLPVIGNACKQAGITLLYHNHDFEFLKTADGEYILDYIYRRATKDELQVELDTCWTKFSGIDPVEYMRKYHDRLPIVHLKDYNGAEPFEFKAVGYGVQDIPAILSEAVVAGTQWVIVEQDGHTEHTPMKDARLSIEYLKTLGW